MIDRILHKVSKPSRYIGGEIHAVRKDPAAVRTRFALIFPDAYEIGMSHLGLKILYHILNQREDVYAERAYAPWPDMEEVLRKENLLLFSLETRTPLGGFDILGITLPYEMCYTNILNILDLSGLPLESARRDATHPLVLGGGTTVFNPEPVAEFFDAFVLGDGEEAIHEVVDCHQRWKGRGESREQLLKDLAGIEGVYVPAFHQVAYGEAGEIAGIVPIPPAKGGVKRRIVAEMDRLPYPEAPPIPFMQTVHDRLTVEVARGCTYGCRFCQAGMTYRPVRERSPERVREIVESGVSATGYEEVSLVSLSTGDYACLTPLLTSLGDRYAGRRVSFSLPSLRIGTLNRDVIREATRTRNKSFTIAPEAGSERLRRVINKPLDEREMEATAARVFEEGCKAVKLYFMLGLPTETYEDLDGIVRMAGLVLAVARKYGRNGRDITVSVSTFVPKSHTPFQWEGQIPLAEIRARGAYLRDQLRRHRIQFKDHSPEMSFLEAVFSRGDRRLAAVVREAWKAGCRFDGWTEHLMFSRWVSVFEALKIDPAFYADRRISLEAVLPWDHLETGATKDFLLLDYGRSMTEKVIPDCRYGRCYDCGVCDLEAVRGKGEGIKPVTYGGPASRRVPRNQVLEEAHPEDAGGGRPSEKRRGAVPETRGYRGLLRLQYAKVGRMRWLSQLELMTAFQRALARGEIPVAWSEGFHPHPKVSFGPALPVGTEGLAEYLDLEIAAPISPAEVERRLNGALPEGFVVTEVREILPGVPSLNSLISGFAYEIWMEGVTLPEMNWKEEIPLPDALPVTVRRGGNGNGKGEMQTMDLRPYIEEVRWIAPGRLYLMLKSEQGKCGRPAEAAAGLFGIPADAPLRIVRLGLYARVAGRWIPPMHDATDRPTVVSRFS